MAQQQTSPATDALIEAAIARARSRFVAALPDRLAALQDHLTSMSQGGDLLEGFEAVRQELHRIAGSAGTVGFHKLGTLAADLDRDLADLTRDGLTPAKVNRLLDAIAEAMAEMKAVQ